MCEPTVSVNVSTTADVAGAVKKYLAEAQRAGAHSALLQTNVFALQAQARSGLNYCRFKLPA